MIEMINVINSFDQPELKPSLNENVGSKKLFLYQFLLVVSTIGTINFVIAFILSLVPFFIFVFF